MNRREEIRKELAEIAPFLAGLEPRSAFKVPKGYFEELPDTILESVSPLAELKKEPAFSVPKNYFESLPDLVLERVAPKQDTETVAAPVASRQSTWLDDLINSIAVLFQPRYALRLAAAAIILIGGFVFIQNQTTSNFLAEAEMEPLEEYGIGLDDLNDEDLALLLSEADVEVDDSEDIDALLDDLLENLDELSDEDLEGLL